MFQSIVDTISGSEWSYAIVFGVALLDAFFPLVPSETTVIAAGVLAAHGDLRIELVLIAAAAGAICRRQRHVLAREDTRGARRGEDLQRARRRHLDRAHKMVEERGGYLIVIARFIPAGRTAVTFACGSLDWAWIRFIKFDVVAGVIWGSYASLLGYFGGKTFEDSPFKGFLVAFAVAIGITCGVEVVRWIRKREGAHS